MSKQDQQSQKLDGFIPVKSSKRKRRTKYCTSQRPASGSPAESTEDNLVIDVNQFLRYYAETELDLKSSSYFENTVAKVVPILRDADLQTIICLGLGKLSECPIARHQLAFIRCLRQELNFSEKIRYFDPVFSRQEVDILHRLDGEVLSENREGKYLAEGKTLFYLPHCPKQISNNLLWRNWSKDLLGNVFLIGNSFDGIIQNSPRRLLEKNAHFILEIVDYCQEIEFENIFKHSDIFNDTSLHYFDTGRLSSKSEEFWNSPEPNYTEEDLELITKSIQTGLQISQNGSS